MPETRSRTIAYRRATWVGGAEQTLELLVASAWRTLNSTEMRTFAVKDGHLQGAAISRRARGTAVHIVRFERDQDALLVPDPSTDRATALQMLPPPPDNSFLSGDAFALMAGDDVLLCTSGLHRAQVALFFRKLLQAYGYNELADRLDLMPCSNIDKLRIIREEGVHSIDMNSTAYEATSQYEARRGAKDRFFSRFGEGLRALTESDEVHDLEGDHENLSVSASIRFDKRKHGEVAQRALTSVAQSLLEEDEEDGFTIETLEGTRLRHSEVVVSDKFEILASGSSINRDDAWRKLDQYYASLSENGILAQ